jgi:hypothetical protein
MYGVLFKITLSLNGWNLRDSSEIFLRESGHILLIFAPQYIMKFEVTRENCRHPAHNKTNICIDSFIKPIFQTRGYWKSRTVITIPLLTFKLYIAPFIRELQQVWHQQDLTNFKISIWITLGFFLYKKIKMQYVDCELPIMIPRSLTDGSQSFSGSTASIFRIAEIESSRFLRNVGNHLPEYTVSQPKSQQCRVSSQCKSQIWYKAKRVNVNYLLPLIRIFENQKFKTCN